MAHETHQPHDPRPAKPMAAAGQPGSMDAADKALLRRAGYAGVNGGAESSSRGGCPSVTVMTCWLDGMASEDLSRAMAEHLRRCKVCEAKVAELRAVLAMAEGELATAVPAGAAQRAMALRPAPATLRLVGEGTKQPMRTPHGGWRIGRRVAMAATVALLATVGYRLGDVTASREADSGNTTTLANPVEIFDLSSQSSGFTVSMRDDPFYLMATHGKKLEDKR